MPDDVYPKVPSILQRMTPYANLTAPILSGGKIPKSKKVFDNAKVTDHHAIIPTGESPNRLEGREKMMYHLIARRFIAVFYPDCVFNSTTVMATVGSHEFKATGKVIVEPGWRVIYASDKRDDSEKEADATMPQFSVGESRPHEPDMVKKTTQPPKFYSEGTLLRAMETAGRTVDDEELRDAMKENGIGRPSTRAAIIETLHRRHYIYRDKKSIKASQAGIDLIQLINVDLLKSAKLTGLWENKLRRIERGDYTSLEFMAELKEMVNGIVLDVLRDNSARRIVTDQQSKQAKPTRKADDKPKKPRAKPVTKLEQVVCPACGQGHLLKGRTAYGCSRYKEGCKLLLPFSDYAETLTPGKLNQMLNKKRKK